jgi:transketolase
LRNAFTKALVRAARQDPRVLLLTGDHGYALFDEFRQLCPGQYLNAGVAEQNMVGVAAGLAKGGLRPVVYGLSAFVPIRVLEQIKLDVCYEQLPVVFIGDGAGVVYSALGSSHQSTEDIAVLRALPHMSILSPADAWEMTACMEMALHANSPVYLRMGKADLGEVHARPPSLEWGKLCALREGGGCLAWIATGSMVRPTLRLAEYWPGSAVYSVPCLKPLHPDAVAPICGRHRAIITLEEHSVFGGLGAAISEIVTTCAPTWVCRVGIPDRFSQFCGSYSYLLTEHGLDDAAILSRVDRFLEALPDGGIVRRAQSFDQPAACPVGT